MSDMEEGDVPYKGLFCECGLAATPDCTWCPDCARPWPKSLGQRSPYDGGPDVHSERTLLAAETAVLRRAWEGIRGVLLGEAESFKMGMGIPLVMGVRLAESLGCKDLEEFDSSGWSCDMRCEVHYWKTDQRYTLGGSAYNSGFSFRPAD